MLIMHAVPAPIATYGAGGLGEYVVRRRTIPPLPVAAGRTGRDARGILAACTQTLMFTLMSGTFPIRGAPSVTA